MKKTFELRTGIFGEGKPKICVPIVAERREDIWKKAVEIAALPVELVEWRVDFYEDVWKTEEVLITLRGLEERLVEKALLFTFRTSKEGGNRAVEEDVYYSLNEAAASSGYVDLVDVEAFLNEERTASEIAKLRAVGCHAIASNHDFQKTPTTREMVRRLTYMEKMGADVAKLAVMPLCAQDVLNLLKATITANERLMVPVVTMSMGSMGTISRLCGSLTGSAMTFATAGEASAPGQIGVGQMAEILEILR